MIYICIPALNEAPTVGVLLWRIRQVMTEFRRDFHLIVLDDGSTDATAEVLAPYARVLPLTLLRNERTAGYAAALEALLREASSRSTHPKRDIAVVVQADFTEPPEEIPALVKKLEGGADVVGSAVAGGDAELPRGLRWSRRGLPWLLGRRRLPAEGGDPMSGFRAYRIHVIRRAIADREGAPLLTRQGWAANAELLMAVAPHTRRADVASVQLRYNRRERETRFNPWPALRETWELARRAPRPVLGPPPEAAPPKSSAPENPPSAAPEGAPPRQRSGSSEGAPQRQRSASSEGAAPRQRSASPEGAAPRQRSASQENAPRRQRSAAPENAPPRQQPAPAENVQPPQRRAAAENAPTRTSEAPENAGAAPEGEAPRRSRSRPRRRPRPAAAAENAGPAPAESAEGTAEGTPRRRPPRRNRKRGRGEGNKEDPS